MSFIPRKNSTEFIEASSLARPTGRLRKIGGGHCGSVWANPESSQDSTDVVVKLENRDQGRPLANDYHVHYLITSCLGNLTHPLIGRETRINFPANPVWLCAEKKEAWDLILPNLPLGTEPCNALVSERIPTWSRLTRVRLARDFCLEPLQVDILGDKKNEDFLIRPYLGRRRRQHSDGTPLRYAGYSLRDFPLHADQIAQVGLSIYRYARAMAEALAFLHWSAAVDAAGVEFILAPDRAETSPTGTLGSGELYKDDYFGDHCLWVLDFHRCQPISMNDHGIDMAVEAFFRNAPFYPTPGTPHEGDWMVWPVFRDHYVRMSEDFVKGRGAHVEKLPALFTTQVELRANEFLYR